MAPSPEPADVSGPNEPDDATASFVAAATAALAAGRRTISVLPGHYHCPGMTSDAMSGVYVVGNGVTFSPETFVAAFSDSEWATRSRITADTSTANGAIAFECDDALVQQWQTLFPWSKRMQVPLGVAWPSALTPGHAPWVKEAWRHGWDVLAHGSTHDRLDTMTEAQLDADCQAALAAVEAVTGQRDNVAMVYPEHLRNANSDRICSKYFTRGRGVASWQPTPRTGAHSWLTSAAFLDPELVGGTLTKKVADALKAVARSDGRLLLYFHHNAVTETTNLAALTEIVRYARGLGIAIESPSRLYPGSVLTPDPYQADASTLRSSGTPVVWSRSAERAYQGTHSMKATPTTGWGTETLRFAEYLPSPAKPGRFAVCRASFRYHAAANVAISPGWGLQFAFVVRGARVDGTSVNGPLEAVGPRFPTSGSVIPAATTWPRVSRTCVFGPLVREVLPCLQLANLAAGTTPFHVDELKLELVDEATTFTFEVVLAGTAGRTTSTGVIDVGRYAITLTPKAATAGRLHVTTDATDRVTVYSTDPADTTQTVVVTVHAGASFESYSWADTGA